MTEGILGVGDAIPDAALIDQVGSSAVTLEWKARRS